MSEKVFMKPLTQRQLLVRTKKYQRNMEIAVFQLELATHNLEKATKEVARIKQRICEVFASGRKRSYTAVKRVGGRKPRDYRKHALRAL